MRLLFLIFSLLLIPMVPLPAAAVTLTPANVAQRVRTNNPDLAAARLRIREAEGRLQQSGRLANPEVDLSLQHDPRFRAGEVEAGFAQRFPLTNRLELERRVSTVRLQAAAEEVAEVERALVVKAREQVVLLLLLDQRGSLLHEQLKTAAALADRLEENARTGEGSPLDAGHVRLQAATLRLGLKRMELERSALAAELGALAGLAGGAGEAVKVGGLLPAPSLPPLTLSPERRPDYRASRLGVAAARESVALERARRTDDLEAGLFTLLERTPEGDDAGMIGLRLRLPLPLWNRNEGGIAEARARQERSEREVEALGRTIEHEAAAAHTAMRHWLELLGELDNTLLPLASAQAEATEKASREGLSAYRSFLESREQHQTLRLSRLDALREFHLARLRYEAALGLP